MECMYVQEYLSGAYILTHREAINSGSKAGRQNINMMWSSHKIIIIIIVTSLTSTTFLPPLCYYYVRKYMGNACPKIEVTTQNTKKNPTFSSPLKE